MGNPLLKNPFDGVTPTITPQVKSIAGILNGQDPMTVFMQYAQSNPQMRPIINMLQNGTSPEQLVRSICKERNINVDEFMKQFKR